MTNFRFPVATGPRHGIATPASIQIQTDFASAAYAA
jgi:hypothetical protein